jgi:hypothetical protein
MDDQLMEKIWSKISEIVQSPKGDDGEKIGACGLWLIHP